LSFLFDDLHLLVQDLRDGLSLADMAGYLLCPQSGVGMPDMTTLQGKTIKTLKGKVELLLFLFRLFSRLLFFPNLQLVALGAQADVAEVFYEFFTAHFAEILLFRLFRGTFRARAKLQIFPYKFFATRTAFLLHYELCELL
jgi:hypothetical protein